MLWTESIELAWNELLQHMKSFTLAEGTHQVAFSTISRGCQYFSHLFFSLLWLHLLQTMPMQSKFHQSAKLVWKKTTHANKTVDMGGLYGWTVMKIWNRLFNLNKIHRFIFVKIFRHHHGSQSLWNLSLIYSTTFVAIPTLLLEIRRTGCSSFPMIIPSGIFVSGDGQKKVLVGPLGCRKET